MKYVNNKEIKFDEYYKLDVNDKAFYYNLCDIFKGTQIKFVMERHLKEHHFNFK